MEAAAITWRPLGRLLVEQGLLSDEELELALAKQQITGKRLGETIVECGFVSRPDLSNALAAQYGIELTTETGFGTGLRAQIQQRHGNDRGRFVQLGLVPTAEPAVEVDPEPLDDEPRPAEALLLAQLEEQWAKLAAAEEELAEREAALAAAVVERDGRRAQAARLARLARGAREELKLLSESVHGHMREQRAAVAAAEERQAELERALVALAADRDRRRLQALRFARRARSRDERLELREEELRRLGQEADARVDEQGAQLAAVQERQAELERTLVALTADRDRRRLQALRLARRARGRDQLAASQERHAELERARAALAADRDRRRAQVVRLIRRVRARDEELGRRSEEMRAFHEAVEGLRQQVERLTRDVQGCDAEIDRLRNENARRRAQAERLVRRLREPRGRAQEADPVPTIAGHLVFVQLAEGYSLVERDGPPPPRHAPLELPDLCDGTLVVSALRRSPLPGDARPCVVAERS